MEQVYRESWLERLLRLLKVERHDIGRKDVGVYLTRWVLIGSRYGTGRKVFLHLFHRGDVEPYNHDCNGIGTVSGMEFLWALLDKAAVESILLLVE